MADDEEADRSALGQSRQLALGRRGDCGQRPENGKADSHGKGEIIGYSNEPPLQAIYLVMGIAITVIAIRWLGQAGMGRDRSAA